jgi:hypothetical protein
MVQLILFLVLGAGFLILLYLFAGRKDTRSEGGAEALLGARQALDCLQTGLLPHELITRIFAREDLHFIASTRSAGIADLFARERKRVALRWVAQIRKQVLSLKEFHSGQSRRYAQLAARTEIALALDFARLLIVCRILEVVFYVCGPYAAPKVVERVVGAAGKVCDVSEKCLAFLSPGEAGRLRGSAGNKVAI